MVITKIRSRDPVCTRSILPLKLYGERHDNSVVETLRLLIKEISGPIYIMRDTILLVVSWRSLVGCRPAGYYYIVTPAS